MIWLVIFALLIYWLLKHHYTYWKRKGIPQCKPVPILGDFSGHVFRTQSLSESIETIYKTNSNSRYVGVYQFLETALMIRDPQLIKQMAVQDFGHFLDHRSQVAPEVEPIIGNAINNLKGQKWREMRSALSPSFSSGKIKHLFALMVQNGEQFIEHFLQQGQDVISVDMKDTFSKFTCDIIINLIFGLECNSFKEPNNEFYLMEMEATDITKFRKMFAYAAHLFAPKLFAFLRLKIFSQKIVDFFTNIVIKNIESREKYGIQRSDMLDELLGARRNYFKNDEHENAYTPETGFATVQESSVGARKKYKKAKITIDDITAQAFFFMLAGSHTVRILMTFLAYELAVNRNIQEKLILEVDKTRKKCQSKITFEDLSTMKYLDMVISETLRKYPALASVDRICTKPYVLELKESNEKTVYFRKGDRILIPIYPIHRDPQYYPDPERFDPERFNEENKKKLVPYTFMPFGVGPRACIGSRFALIEIKVLFFYLLSNFEIVPIDKTQIPVEIDKKSIVLDVKHGWIGFKRRVK